MTSLLVQIIATFALVLGIAGGEVLSTRAFGIFKKSWFYILEIVIFVIAIVIILNNFSITKLNPTLIILFYFLIGFFTIIVIRAGMTGFGIISEQIQEKVLKIRKEKDFIIGLRKALKRKGFEEEKIRKIAKEVGFKEDKIDDVFDYWDE